MINRVKKLEKDIEFYRIELKNSKAREEDCRSEVMRLRSENATMANRISRLNIENVRHKKELFELKCLQYANENMTFFQVFKKLFRRIVK